MKIMQMITKMDWKEEPTDNKLPPLSTQFIDVIRIYVDDTFVKENIIKRCEPIADGMAILFAEWIGKNTQYKHGRGWYKGREYSTKDLFRIFKIDTYNE